jgi:hypothetical protein
VALVPAIVVLALGGVPSGLVWANSRHETPVPHLPGGFASQMRGMGVTFSDVTAVSDEVRAAALHAASNGASPVAGQDLRPVVVRVRFTDNGYRDRGRRLYVDRPALMVIYPSTPVALTGPPGSPSGTVRSTVVDFIDPSSYSYLRAVSFNTSTQVDAPG